MSGSSATALSDISSIRDVEVCIRFFQRTIRGFYQNMTLEECLKKTAESPRRIWLKKDRVTWNEGGQPKQVLLALAFHRRDRFAESSVTPSPPHFYLSVGLGDVNTRPDPNSGQEDDPNLSADGVTTIVETIVATCRAFDNNLAAVNRNKLFIAPHHRLVLAETRLYPIFHKASDLGHLEHMTTPRGRTPATGRRVWPAVNTIKIQNY